MILCLVPPVEEHDVIGKLGNQVGEVKQDIGPDHDAAAILGGEIADTQDVLEIKAPLAETFGQCPGLTRSEVPGLVAIDVEPGRREIGQEVGVQLVEELIGLLAGWRQAPLPTDLVEMGVAGQREQASQVSERLEVRDEFDVMSTTVRIEREDVVSGQWIGAGTDLRVTREVKGVLDVELNVIVFVGCEVLDQAEERLERGHFAARDVEHDTTVGEHRPIADGERREQTSLCSKELTEGLDAIEEPAFRRGEDEQSLLPDG
jgi:hypothetical protein